MKIFSSLVVLYTLYLILIPFNLAMAEGLDLGVNPPIIQIDATSPASINSPITIENSGEDLLEIEVLFRPFKANSLENGTVEYFKQTDTFPSGNILFLQRVQLRQNNHTIKTFRLAPQEQKTFELHIGLPKNEVPADYYFSVVFLGRTATDSSDETTENSQTTVAQGGVATNVLLSVGPKSPAKATITEFSAPFFKNTGPIPFTLRVENTGKHTIAPRGEIFIKNIFNQTIGKVELLPVNILAGSTRRVPDSTQLNETGSVNQELAVTYMKEHPVALWMEKFLLGPYVATVNLKLTDTGPVITQSTYFFAFPIEGIFAIAITICFIVIIRQKVKARMK